MPEKHEHDTIEITVRLVRTSIGLTIVEVVVAIAVAMTLSIGVVGLFGGFFSNSAMTVESVRRTSNLQSAVNVIQSDVNIATSFERSADQSEFQNWYGNGNITGQSSDRRSIILRLPATTAEYQNPSRQAIYTNASDPTTATCPKEQSRVMVTVLVQYYVEDSTLYRRMLTPNPAPTACNNASIAQRQTSRTGPSRDMEVARDVNQLQVEYYSSGAVETVDPDAYNGGSGTLEGVVAARLTIASDHDHNGVTEPIRYSVILAKGTR